MKRLPITAIVLLALALTLPALAQDSPEGLRVPPEDLRHAAFTVGSGRTLWLFPTGDVYPVYIADPHKAESAAMVHFYTRATIFESSDARAGLKGGGRFGLMRLDPAAPGGRSWQLSLDAGLDAQFDSKQKLDNIGWDGNYGFTLTTASGGPLSFKLAVLHLSAHVGDEYAERTGRTRIDYTREELAFGLGWRLTRGWRAYAEGGYGYYLLTEEQQPWRVQGGLEYVTRHTLLGGRFAWYAAVDFQSFEERDWRLDTAIQTGLTTKAGGRRVRIGVQYDDGRAPMGEFFQNTEAWITLAIWIDL